MQMQPFHDCMCSTAVFVCPLDCSDVLHACLLWEVHQAVVDVDWEAAVVVHACLTPFGVRIHFIYVWLVPQSVFSSGVVLRGVGPVYPASSKKPSRISRFTQTTVSTTQLELCGWSSWQRCRHLRPYILMCVLQIEACDRRSIKNWAEEALKHSSPGGKQLLGFKKIMESWKCASSNGENNTIWSQSHSKHVKQRLNMKA